MAFGDHSPRAALTGTRPPTLSMTAATTSASAGASGPLAGSFTSIRSAPPASAAFTSSADRTLTRSLGVALMRGESFHGKGCCSYADSARLRRGVPPVPATRPPDGPQLTDRYGLQLSPILLEATRAGRFP